jgi:thiol-disulfide isomerase/thioredoxin
MRIAMLIFLWPLYVFGTGIQFFEGTWDEAMEKATLENKPIFLDAFAEWCGPCKLMARSVFPDASVGEFYNEHFINMKIDMEKGEGPGLRSQYKVTAYPTLLFIAPGGEIIQKKVGAIDAKNFLSLGKQIMKAVDKSEEYAKIYDSGERDPEFILKYIKALNIAEKSPLLVSNAYLKGKSSGFSKTDLAIIFESTIETDSRIFELFMDNRSDIENIYGTAAVENKIVEACLGSISKAKEFDTPFILEDYVKMLSKNVKNNALGLNKIALSLLSNFPNDPKLNISAELISKFSCTEDAPSDCWMTYAQILRKNNKTKEALKMGNIALEKSKKEGQDAENKAKAFVEFLKRNS